MALVTPEFRVSYPKVFKPEMNKLSNQMEYSLIALFKKGEDLSKLKKAAEEAIAQKWGPDKTKWPKNLKNPFRDQSDKAKDIDGKRVLPSGHEEGAVFLTLKTKQKPAVVDEQVQPIMDETQFYAGCYARAAVSVYAYDQAGNRGVSFGLTSIQKLRDGEPFSGRPTPEQSFTPVANSSVNSASDLFG